MKIQSLGSLSALAVLCAAPIARSAVVSSGTIVNINLPVQATPQTVNLDIDGNGTDDFQVSGNFGNASVANISLTALSGNGIATVAYSGLDFAQPLALGDTVDFGLTYTSSAYLYKASDTAHSPSSLQSFYAGVEFLGNDGLNHFGWLNLSFPTGGTPRAISAAYDDLENASILIAVPEPMRFSMAGAIALAAFAAFRRRP